MYNLIVNKNRNIENVGSLRRVEGGNYRGIKKLLLLTKEKVKHNRQRMRFYLT